jgi:hypothetical protein
MSDRYGRNGQRFRVFGQSVVLRSSLEQGERAQNHKDNHAQD